MSECTCGTSHEAPTEEIVEAEKSEALDEPVEETSLDKHEELYKDMEQTLAKLKEVMAYLEEMAGEEKAEEEEASLGSKDLREGDEEEDEKKDKPIQSDDVTTKMPVEEEKETLKEWYNNQKFEALKKLWTK